MSSTYSVTPVVDMKTLKQHLTMSYNGRHRHSGTMWESRFTSRESKPTTSDMSDVLAYVDCNPVEGGICAWPTGYKWNSWTMAMNGDPRARQMYEFVYGDAAEDWEGIVTLHEKAIKKRIAEIGEAVGMKSRVQLISAYIRPKLEMNLIQQTIPNSPRAPNQKYKLAS